MRDLVYLSYSQEDRKFRDALREVLLRDVKLRDLVWDNQMVPVGANPSQTCTDKIGRARIVVMLVSPDFIDAKCKAWQVEVPAALEAWKRNETLIIWFAVRETDVTDTPFADIQPAVSTATGLASVMPDEQRRVYDGLRRVIRKVLEIDRDGHFDVFLSHDRQDRAVVDQLTDKLRARGLEPWVDDRHVAPGEHLQPSVVKALAAAPSIAVLIGKSGLGPWQDAEIDEAFRQAVQDHRPVVPVLLRDASTAVGLPYFLAGRAVVDLRAGVTDEGADELVRGLTRPKPPAPPVVNVPPPPEIPAPPVANAPAPPATPSKPPVEKPDPSSDPAKPPPRIATYVAAVVAVANGAAFVYGLFKSPKVAIAAVVGMVFAIVLLIVVNQVAASAQAAEQDMALASPEEKRKKARFWNLVVQVLVAFVVLYFIVFAVMMLPVIRKLFDPAPAPATTPIDAATPITDAPAPPIDAAIDTEPLAPAVDGDSETAGKPDDPKLPDDSPIPKRDGGTKVVDSQPPPLPPDPRAAALEIARHANTMCPDEDLDVTLTDGILWVTCTCEGGASAKDHLFYKLAQDGLLDVSSRTRLGAIATKLTCGT